MINRSNKPITKHIKTYVVRFDRPTSKISIHLKASKYDNLYYFLYESSPSYLGIIESLEPIIIDRVQIPVSCWTKNVVLLMYLIIICINLDNEY